MIGVGSIEVLDDDDLPASLFFQLRNTYGLGPGETECLAFASIGSQVVCCDDRAARSMIATEIGKKRVTGSLGLLIQAVHFGVIELVEAFAKYEKMRLSGGFLPAWTLEQFQTEVSQFAAQ